MEEIRQTFHTLRQPEYVHVLLNPLPIYALAMGVVALAVALAMRKRSAQIVALLIVIVGSASAFPTVYYGQRAYDGIYAMSDADAQQWLDLHMWRAETFVYVFYVAALLAVATLFAIWKFPKAATPLAILALIVALVSLGIGGWIGHAGGQVRHSEFRAGPPPKPIAHEAEHKHDQLGRQAIEHEAEPEHDEKNPQAAEHEAGHEHSEQSHEG